MKKTLRKPAHWQDFEDLCKKLFGEIWKCPYTIKKNGRQGNEQFGVDISAVPDNEIDYYGIQCKGKDEYTHSQLTKKEIDTEIDKAKTFKPILKTFIFATTANKDSIIEEYVRLKDFESRKNGYFRILLYCWEDLVDFIEENRSVYNWYVNGNQFKETHKVWVGFSNGNSDIEIAVPFIRKITEFVLKPKYPIDLSDPYSLHRFIESQQRITIESLSSSVDFWGRSSKINYSWCKFNIYIQNIGEKVLEDWSLLVYIEKGKYKEIDDDSPKGIDAVLAKDHWKYRDYWANEKGGYFKYKSHDNSPLIQKDQKQFRVYLLPEIDLTEIDLTWKLLARDYNDEGTLRLIINPVYEDKISKVEVEEEDMCESETVVEYKIKNRS